MAFRNMFRTACLKSNAYHGIYGRKGHALYSGVGVDPLLAKAPKSATSPINANGLPKMQQRLMPDAKVKHAVTNATSKNTPVSSNNFQKGGDVPSPSQTHSVLGFTCSVCQTRSFKKISKVAYTQGVVIVRCPECRNQHLIADHLGWFEHGKPAGTIEDIMLRKGELVEKRFVDVDYSLNHKSGITNG